MSESRRKLAAARFAAKWAGRGDEKSDTHKFWIELLQEVFGIEDIDPAIEFEDRVKIAKKAVEAAQDPRKGNPKQGFIDAIIPTTNVMIEQKKIGVNLDEPDKQSDGEMLTPYEQAKRYSDSLPFSERARWIVVSNFAEFRVHDMERPLDAPTVILLKNLPDEYERLDFLIDKEKISADKAEKISREAGKFTRPFKDMMMAEYPAGTPGAEQSVNRLCVRLVFCYYADSAKIFDPERNIFEEYISGFRPEHMRRGIIDLFDVLATPEDARPWNLDSKLKKFPYVNGGLFEERDENIPQFTEEIAALVLNYTAKNFSWAQMNTTIFGAVFESSLNPDTRRTGGMHYTSVENIHKVIDPLFLDELRAELDGIMKIGVSKKRLSALDAFQQKLASLTFLDPACGSGNFLTETYLKIRSLENEILKEKFGVGMLLGEIENPVRVSIGQFYGIEINDFAAAVAKAALWIAESQMNAETEEIIHKDIKYFPLKSYPNIIEGNALTMDWEDIVPREKLNYIMGNPPFVGHQWRTKEQNDDMEKVFYDLKKYGKLDYVCGWYNKAADFIRGTGIEVAFVSTNSIVQGESVGILWKFLFEKKDVQIQFAYQTFEWESESSEQAAVHCVIIGFSRKKNGKPKKLFRQGQEYTAKNINGYLLDAPNVYLKSRGKSLSGMPEMHKGSQPTDGGFLLFSQEERDELIKNYPESQKFLRRFISGRDFIQNIKRYCIWLKGVSPAEYRKITPILLRLESVAQVRANSPTESVRRDAGIPMLFTQIRQPDTDYLAVPEVSSQRRKYIPIGYLTPDIIGSNQLYIIPNATMYMFGVLTSNVHMAWMKIVAGRLKSDYRYSPAVYNNFSWLDVTEKHRAKIEQTAKAILDARALYPDASLADLYDEVTMPPELRKAHEANDRAVTAAYGFARDMDESAIVAALMERYRELTAGK